MKTPYAICRAQKLHAKELTKTAHHNFRDVRVLNADASKAILPLLGEKTGREFLQAIHHRFETWKVRKLAEPRKKRGARMAHDPVVCVEILLTASPEYFRPDEVDRAGYWDEKRCDLWQSTVVKFARDYFGDRLVSLVVHFDESTPHIHLLTVPTDEHGDFNAKKLYGRSNLIRLQDAYAEACKPLGLQRGLRGSTAQHQAIKDFYGAVNAPTPQISLEKLKPKATPLPSKIERLDDDNLKAFAASVFKEGAKAASIVYEQKIESIAAKASAYDLTRRNEASVSQALLETRRMANELRTIPLLEVLKRLGATPDLSDGDVWSLLGRTLRINGQKYFDSTHQKKGSGAIDLVKHCEGVNFQDAVAWLALEFGKEAIVGEAIRSVREATIELANKPQPLPIPMACPERLPTVEQYLTQQCAIPTEMVQRLVRSGRLYSDARGHCVFKTKNTQGEGGALVQATNAPQRAVSRGAVGSFVLSPADRNSKSLVLVTTAIDALKYRVMNPMSGWIITIAGLAMRAIRRLVRDFKKNGFSVSATVDDLPTIRMIEQEGGIVIESQTVANVESLVSKPTTTDFQHLKRLNLRGRGPAP